MTASGTATMLTCSWEDGASIWFLRRLAETDRSWPFWLSDWEAATRILRRVQHLEDRTMDAMTYDTHKLHALVTRAVGDLSSANGGVMVSLGHKLGLYKAMRGMGPMSSREVAARARCAERYVREWLASQ